MSGLVEFEANMARRRSVRDIVVDMLEHWGEWERMGLYAASAQKSILGRLIADGPSAPCGAAGPSIPTGLIIPGDVQDMGRMIATMRAECRAGGRYYRALRVRYVMLERGETHVLTRAIDKLEKIFLSEDCRNVKTQYAIG